MMNFHSVSSHQAGLDKQPDWNKSKWYPSPSSIVFGEIRYPNGWWILKTNRICVFFVPPEGPHKRPRKFKELPSFRLVSPSKAAILWWNLTGINGDHPSTHRKIGILICYQYVTNMFHVCLFSLWVLGGSREWWSWEHLLSLLLFLRSMECLYGINILFTHQHASVLYTLFAAPCQFPSWFTWQMTKQNQNVVQRKNPTQIQPEYALIVFCSHHIIYRFRGTNVSVGKNMCKIGTMKWRNTNIQYLLGVVDLTTYKSTSIKETHVYCISISIFPQFL